MAPQSNSLLSTLGNSWNVLDFPVKRNLIWATAIPFLLVVAVVIYALLPGLASHNAPQLLNLTALILYIGPLSFALIVIALIPYYLLYKAHHMIRARFLETRYAGELDALRVHWNLKNGLMLGIWLIAITSVPMNVVNLLLALFNGSILSAETIGALVWIAIGIGLASPCCHRYILMDA